MEPPTADEVMAALTAAGAMWEALATDDDAALERLLPAYALEWLGPEAGVAERVRAPSK